MTANQIKKHCRALLERYPAALGQREPCDRLVAVVAVEAYGQRRLYPITPHADALTALVGSTTLDQRHLDLAAFLGLKTVITTLDIMTASAGGGEAARVADWYRAATATPDRPLA